MTLFIGQFFTVPSTKQRIQLQHSDKWRKKRDGIIFKCGMIWHVYQEYMCHNSKVRDQRVFFKKECCLFYFWNQALLAISFALILFCFPPAPIFFPLIPTFFPLCLNYLCAFDWDNPASDFLPFVLLLSLFELLKITIGVMLMSYTFITGQKLLHKLCTNIYLDIGGSCLVLVALWFWEFLGGI